MKRKLLCLLVVLLCLSPLSAGAAESIDLQKDVSLTLTSEKGGTALAGEVFRLYQVAEVNAYGELTVVEACSAFDVDIRGENDEAWRQLAQTLANYAPTLTPADSGKTDSAGTLRFPTEGKTLKPGLYLVTSDRHAQNGSYYDSTPFLVLLPALDKENNTWNYAVTAAPKHTATSIPDDSPSTVKRKVLKVWADTGAEEQRPAEITVHLLRDGKVYDTVTLSEKNNWRHEWKSLSGDYRWTLTEDTPEGYTVNISREGVTFVVTNTVSTPTPTPTPSDTPTPTPSGTPTPTPSGTPTPTPSGTPTPTPSASTPAPSGTPGPTTKPGTLPQTGQLWWPVPILLCAGLFCVCVGLLRRRGDDHET